MDKKKIIVIGVGSTGLTAALELAAEQNNICVLHSVVDRQFTEPKKKKVFEITRLPEMWFDPKEPITNYKKHGKTCAKNRKKRKKKRRR